MANLKDELWQSPVGVDPFVVHIQNWVRTLRIESHSSTVVLLCVWPILKMNKSSHHEGEDRLFLNLILGTHVEDNHYV